MAPDLFISGAAGSSSPVTYPVTVAQGDLLYGSAADTIVALAKNTTATRYLSNTGTSNNPAWAQVDLSNGVTGTLPVANGGTNAGAFTAGSVVFAGTSGTYTQNNSKFFWNNSTFRLGLGLSPSYQLDVGGAGQDIGYIARFKEDGTTGSTFLTIQTPAGANAQAGLSLFQTTHALEWRVAMVGNAGDALRFVNTSDSEQIHFLLRGNISLNTTHTQPTNGTRGIIFGDGTAFSGMPSNTGGLYANDVSGTVNMYAINEAGEATRLSFPAPQTYAVTNVTTDRTYDANATDINELADVLGTLIADLRAREIVA